MTTQSGNPLVGSAILSAGSTEGTPTRIPASRYYSTEFAVREQEKLWPRVWLLACSMDHVSDSGDYFEFRIAGHSVLIVRGRDGELRGFENVCRHRGNTLCVGAGSGLRNLRCPYHGWTYGLDGELRGVPSRQGFGTLDPSELGLPPVRVETWGQLVFVNLDADAMPLAEYLEKVPGDTAWLGLEEYRCRACVRIEVPANWKVVVDGFSETYHTQRLHDQMMESFDDIDSPQEIWGHTSRSLQHFGVASPRVSNPTAQGVWDSFIANMGGRMGITEPCPAPEVPAGQTIRSVIAERIRIEQAGRGADLSRFSDEEIMDVRQYNLFPNSAVLVSTDLFEVWSAKPGPTPRTAEFFLLSFGRVGSADAPRTKPADVELPYEEADLGLVLNQDLGILRHTQQGLEQRGFTHLCLSSEEARIINTHRNLERYLEIEPSEILGGPKRDT